MKCEECGLSGCPRVEGYGPSYTKIVMIGEAPGRVEVEQGRPFVGPSGQLLREALEEVGIDPESIYWTNTCLCRPPANRTPTKEETTACFERLMTELARRRRPEVYVFVGKTAAETCLGGRIVMKRDANVFHRWRDSKALIIYHPAAVLRNSTLRSRLMAGLRMLVPAKKTEQTRLF